MNIKEAIREGNILRIRGYKNYNCVYCGKKLVTSDYGIYCDNKNCKNYDIDYFVEENDF